MFEVYYKPPVDPGKEPALNQRVASMGGWLEFRENPRDQVRSACLTYEFGELSQAEAAAEALRQLGEHVEGPGDYGPA